MTFMFAAFIAVVVILFVLGWFFTPKGYLTKTIATISLAFTTAHEWMADQWSLLTALVPAEYSAWVVGGFLLMTIAALMRKY